MADVGARLRLPPGSVLIHEGQPIDTLTFVLDGEVIVSVEGVGNVAKLGSGEILGEMSLVDESLPSATVTVSETAEVLAISRDALAARLDADSAFAGRFYRAIAMYLSIRMRATVKRLGYGNAPPTSEEELDIALLDAVHIAGARFDRMIKRLLGK